MTRIIIVVVAVVAVVVVVIVVVIVIVIFHTLNTYGIGQLPKKNVSITSNTPSLDVAVISSTS